MKSFLKKQLFLGLFTLFFLTSKTEAQVKIAHNPPDWWSESYRTLDQRMEWWEEARFALFVHWGAYSILGGEYKDMKMAGMYAEHIASVCKIPKKEYIELAAGKFQPEKFDAEEWVLLAKNAGMKYVVITAKHHDGFSIFDSEFTDFDIKGTAKWDRDPLMELSNACKKHGLKFGVYYSHAQDWYEEYNVRNNWDFNNPTNNRWYEQDTPETREHIKNMEKYYIDTKAIPQVKELIKRYDVSMIWFDTSIWMPFELRMKVLKAAREAKPDLIVNQRAVGFGKGNYGDYTGGPDSPVVFADREDPYWEAIQSTTHSWGYNKFDEQNRRSPEYLLKMLATTVSKGGNLMINIGPKGDGIISDADVSTLKYFADWMGDHSEAIHGAKRSPLPTQNWGVVTSKDNDLYLHVFDWPKNGELKLVGLTNKIESAFLMKGQTTLKTKKKNNFLIINVPEKPSHSSNSVIKISCINKPVGDAYRLLETEKENRLHTYDNGILIGDELFYNNGKGTIAYIQNWRNASSKIQWKALLEKNQKYNVQIIYDIPKKGEYNDDYQLKIGDQVLNGTVNRIGTGNKEHVNDEIKKMRLSDVWLKRMKTDIIVDDLGEITLEKGVMVLELAAKGEIESEELFMPRALIITPL
jgi:alpha-L-fucosidase